MTALSNGNSGEHALRASCETHERQQRARANRSELDELGGLLGLTAVGKRIEHVKVWGGGTRADVHIKLVGGEVIRLAPLGAACSTPHKLAMELASQAGAAPELRQRDVVQAMKAIHDLGEHFDASEAEDQAVELAAEYLRLAAVGDVAYPTRDRDGRRLPVSKT